MIYEIQETIGSGIRYADITPSLSVNSVSGLNTKLHNLESKLNYINKLQKRRNWISRGRTSRKR